MGLILKVTDAYIFFWHASVHCVCEQQKYIDPLVDERGCS